MADASELAKLMLKWEAQKLLLDELETAIRDSVLLMQMTQTVGNVRATYSKGRKSYNYEEAVTHKGLAMVSDATMALFTKTRTTTTIDWRGICKHDGIEGDELPFTQGAPSVRIKLLS